MYARKTWEVAQEELDIAKKELKNAQQFEERREAIRVAAWLTSNEHYNELLDLYVANMNPLPVFDVEINVFAMIKEGADSALIPEFIWSKTLGTLPPGGPEKSIDSLDGTPHIKDAWNKYTQKQTVGGVVANWTDWKVWSGKDEEAGIALEISFRDTSGIYWKRGIKGSLKEQTAV